MIYIIILSYLVIVNIVAFFMYRADKEKAKAQKWRTPERVLIGVAAIGGSIGALAGMKVFRHKTQHPQFKYGIPAILIVQVLIALAIGYFVYFA